MKAKIKLSKQQFEDLERGCTVEILLDGVPAYICRADYKTGLDIADMDVEINYYAPDPEDYEIEVC